jgi:hypothetical protein
MHRQVRNSVVTTVLAFCALAAYLVSDPLFAQQPSAPPSNPSSDSALEAQAPSPDEMKTRTNETLANQHADDNAIDEYEYIQREIDRAGGANPRTIEERTFRVVPTGTGMLRILLKNNGHETDPTDYRRQLQAWQNVLQLALHPDDPREKTAYAKFEKKKRDRAEMVDATRQAFNEKWIGLETIAGHRCDVVELTPNPGFRPHSMLQEALTHFTAKAWVDHDSNQLVRGEAHVIRDISVGGGILGKLYRGGVFSFQQTPVAPGVWLPSRYQYDFMGRKLFFTFEVHQVVESSQFRRIGPPKAALTAVQNELAAGKVIQADP